MLNRQEFSSLRQGLVGCWVPSLGASGYTLLDRSGRSNHGTLTNMAGQNNWQANGSGLTLNFDGSNDYVAIPSSAALASAVWCSFWFYLTASFAGTSSKALLALSAEAVSPYRENIYVGFNIIGQGPSLNTGKLGIVSYDGSNAVVTSGAYSNTDFSSLTNRWTHASLGWNGSAWKVFVNGVDETNAEGTQRILASFPTNPSTINASGRACACQMDDIRAWSRPLTLSEIRLLSSRRGIGLTPLPDRAAGMPRKLSVNVGGTWRPADAYLNVGGTWKLAQASVNVSGTWK